MPYVHPVHEYAAQRIADLLELVVPVVSGLERSTQTIRLGGNPVLEPEVTFQDGELRAADVAVFAPDYGFYILIQICHKGPVSREKRDW